MSDGNGPTLSECIEQALDDHEERDKDITRAFRVAYNACGQDVECQNQKILDYIAALDASRVELFEDLEACQEQ